MWFQIFLMVKLCDGSYICVFLHKEYIKDARKAYTDECYPPRAESLYQCRRAHSGHRSLEGRRPLTSQEDASHVNHHKHIKTAFMFVQPFAHSDISHPFRDRHYALGGTYIWPHFCQKYRVYHFREKWLKRWRANFRLTWRKRKSWFQKIPSHTQWSKTVTWMWFLAFTHVLSSFYVWLYNNIRLEMLWCFDIVLKWNLFL